jgi:hypothetical protein
MASLSNEEKRYDYIVVEADNSAARTEPAAPAPTTMKSYRSSSFDTLIILNSTLGPSRRFAGRVKYKDKQKD